MLSKSQHPFVPLGVLSQGATQVESKQSQQDDEAKTPAFPNPTGVLVHLLYTGETTYVLIIYKIPYHTICCNYCRSANA